MSNKFCPVNEISVPPCKDPKKGLTAEIRAAVWYSNCKVDDVKSIPPLNDKDTATYPGLCAGATHSSVLLDIHTDSDEI